MIVRTTPRARLSFAILVATAAALPLTQCSTLPAIPQDTCGNGVIDPREACDTFATMATAPEGGADAGAASACGQTGAGACLYVCGQAGARYLAAPPAASPVCPTGWGCGVDGVCRQPSGAFTPVGNPIPAGAWRVSLADFDGDQIQDAVTRGTIDGRGFSQVRVEFLGSDFTVQDAFVPQSLFGSPQIADMNGDGIADLAYEYDDLYGVVGLGVLLGNTARKPTQVPYPVIDLPASARYYALPFDDGTYNTCAYLSKDPALAGKPPVLLGLDIGNPSAPGQPITQFALPGDSGQQSIVEGMTLGRLFPTTNTPCDDVVFAFGNVNGGKSAVHVVVPCKADMDGWAAYAMGAGNQREVDLPDQLEWISYQPRLGDVNGDGLLDLLIPATTVATGRDETYVAYNTGSIAGGFTSTPQGPPVPMGAAGVVTELFTASVTTATGTQTVPIGAALATGDLNGDGVVDVVASNGIYLSEGAALPHGWALATATFNWTAAIIADFNRDGLPDVFAGNVGVPDLDFFAGVAPPPTPDGGVAPPVAPSRALAHSFLPTSGGAGQFSAGDFDGDGTTDLGFSQSDPTGDGEDEVDIVYGVPYQFPSAFVTVGSFQPVLQTVVIPAIGTSPLDFVVVASTPTGGSTVTYLPQTSARPPLSALILNTAQLVSGGSGVLLTFGSIDAFVAAPFTKTTDSDTMALLPDVAALAFGATSDGAVPMATPNGKTSTWFLGSSGTPAQFNSPIQGQTTATPSVAPVPAIAQIDPTTTDTSGYFALMAAADLDNDGTPEAVVLAPSVCGSLSAPAMCLTESTLLIGAFQGATAPDPFEFTPSQRNALAFPMSQQGQLAIADVDGDGYRDIVILSGSDADSGLGGLGACGAGITRGLYVLFNDGTGNFASVVPAPVVQGKGPCDDPTAFAMLTLSPNGPPVIAYVTRTGAHYAQFAGSPSSPSFTLLLLPDVPESAEVDCCTLGYGGDDYSGIAAGDVDGDGVQDFVLVDHGDLYPYKGVATVPGAP